MRRWSAIFLRRWRLLPFLFALLWGASAAAQPAGDDIDTAFAEAVTSLAGKSFPERERAVSRIAELAHPRTLEVLQALLDGALHADGEHVLIVRELDGCHKRQ
jgi:hypothetical protein